jgi:uncharacterized membrane protein YbaN (DUF454 family)
VQRVLRQGSGYGLVAIGLAGMILPGPGVPFLLAGLVVLARDRPWAAALLARVPAWVPGRRAAPAR